MSKPLSERAKKLQEEWGLSHIFTRKLDEALADERENVREKCDEGLSYMKENLEVKEAEAGAVTDGIYEKGRVSGLTIALGVIRGLDLTALDEKEKEKP